MSETLNFRLPRRKFLMAGLAGLLMPGAAGAQTYPSSIIRIVVPTSAGTPPDIISRMISDGLATNEGWRFVVENRPGALQTIAMNDVSGRPADGYSLLTMSLPMTVTPSLFPRAEIRPDVDFDPVIKISRSYTVLVTTPSLPVNSLSELVALLKSKPGKLNFSSAGFGTPSHLIGEMFAVQAGVRASHVPYQQFSQAIADLISGNVQYMFVTTLPVIDLIATGKLRALAVTAPTRIAALKEVPVRSIRSQSAPIWRPILRVQAAAPAKRKASSSMSRDACLPAQESRWRLRASMSGRPMLRANTVIRATRTRRRLIQTSEASRV